MASSSTHFSTRSELWDELLKLARAGLAIFTLLALFSFAPSDPSWSTWSSNQAIQNWMGRTGSIFSDLLFQLLGFLAFLPSVLLLLRTWPKFSLPSPRTPARQIIGQTLLLVSACGLANLLLPVASLPWGLRSPGGLVGTFTFGIFNGAFGFGGALLVLSVLLFMSGILSFGWRVRTFVAFVKAKAIALKPKFLAFVAKISARWLPRKSEAPAEPTLSGPLAVAVNPLPIAPLPMAPLPLAPRLQPLPLAPVEHDEEIAKVLTSKSTVASPKPSSFKKLQDGLFTLPDLSILSGRADSNVKQVDKNWYMEKASILVEKLKDFGVEGEVVNISPGPVITVYEFKPASGVKIKDIANLSDDLTLALSVLSVRIVAPIPGKPVVGIEIPSPHRETVFFKDLVQETSFFGQETRIPIVLGRLASGEPILADLAAMPHVLVAGATGTGKSVFINTLICSLLYRHPPKMLRLILVDPKMVELSTYEDIPHLLLPVVVDSKKAAMALRWTVDEMERRYTLMHQMGVRHIDAYNEKISDPSKQESGEHTFLPYIVVVIDEYADLMSVVPKDVEFSIARLAQKARASGIHLVLATQRPSTDVVTGTIKANFPSRISFRVASSVDSKTILDRAGAERLLGNGDMLFHSAGFLSLKRLQGAYIADAEIERIVNHLKAQGEPQYDQRIIEYQQNADAPLEGEVEANDEEQRLYDTAVRLVADKGEASISLIQRHLKIGYNRAATLMELMEKEGVVSPETGTSKRRTVLVG